jgi:hypothetical protein
MAVFWLVNFLTGVTPGSVFQMPTNRAPGQVLAKAIHSASLWKVSKGVVLFAAASSGLANATISLYSVMVYVVIDSFSPYLPRSRGHHMNPSLGAERQGLWKDISIISL